MTAWAKIASDLDANPKIRKAGRDGREVFLFVIRRNAALDLGGRIPLEHIEPEYLADQLMMTADEARHGTSRAVTAGLLRVTDGFVVISGWNDEWAKRPLTEAERQQRRRDKIKNSTGSNHNVTERHAPIVTCPDNHGSEERREEKSITSGKPDDSPLNSDEIAALALAEVSIREINRLAKTSYSPGARSVLKLCRALHKAKHTTEEVSAVIAYRRPWLSDAKMREYFRPATLLALKNFETYLDEIAGKQKPQRVQVANVVDDFEPMPALPPAKGAS